MSFERSSRDLLKLSKRIPLHYQKRYLANISNGSFNATFLTGAYKNKIKSLLKNNRTLALALNSDRIKKEELLIESKVNSDLILFSTLHLANMSENLKKVVSEVDETLSMLQMHSSAALFKCTPKNTISKKEFKDQLKDVVMDAIPEETNPLESKNLEKVTTKCSVECRPVQEKQYSPKLKESSNFVSTITKPVKLGEEVIISETKEINATELNEKKNSTNYQAGPALKTKTKTTGSKKTSQKTVPKQILDTSANDTLHLTTKRKVKAVSKPPKKGKIENNFKNSDLILKKGDKSHNIIDENKLTEKEIDSSDDIYAKKVTNSNSDLKQNNLENNDFLIPSEIISTNLDSFKSLTDKAIQKNVSGSKVCSYSVKDQRYSNELKNNSPNPRTKKSEIQTPLKNFSSKLNIENLKLEKRKSKKSLSSLQEKASQNKKENLINIAKQNKFYQIPLVHDTQSSNYNGDSDNENNYPSNMDTRTSDKFMFCSEKSLDQEEMIKNLAINTFIVTAQVHMSPKQISSSKSIKQNNSNCFQPYVLMQDIFKSNKSFCESISPVAVTDKNKIPLKFQLVKHCSSFKVIPEEGSGSQNESSASSGIGQSNNQNTKDNQLKKTEVFSEPLLTVEGEIKDCSIETNRKFRKRSSVCYKEPVLNKKLRR